MIATPTPRIYAEQLSVASDQSVVIGATKWGVLTTRKNGLKRLPSGRSGLKAVFGLLVGARSLANCLRARESPRSTALRERQ